MRFVVIVLQVGKVGSWTMVRSLQAAKPELQLLTLSQIASGGD